MPRGVRGLERAGATIELRIGVIGGRPKEENTRDMVMKYIKGKEVKKKRKA